MREAVGIPAGILVYSVSTIILLIAVEVTFANPNEWSTLITATIAIIAFRVTCTAVKNFSNETGVKIVGLMIALFWLVSFGINFFIGAEGVMEFLSGGQDSTWLENFKELIEAVWNLKICAGVSVILALWTLGK